MNKFITRFKAQHEEIDAIQYSCFTWQQDGEDLDRFSIRDQIAQTSAIQFFKTFDNDATLERIIVEIDKIEKFN